MTEEVWTEVVGYSDYAVSTYGRVKSLKSDQILKPYQTSYGHLQVSLRKDGKTHTRYVHTLVAEAFITAYEPGLHIRFANGDKTDNNVYNLRFRHGRRMGLLNTKAPPAFPRKVLVHQTGQVFRTVTDCARHFGADASTIYKVLRGERVHHQGYTFAFIYEE